MAVLIVAALLTAAVLALTFFIREKDIPAPVPVPPGQHLIEHKAQIYENLRDLQFEYRVGKLSDEDYQKTKLELQRELAKVMAELDALKPVQAAHAAQAVRNGASSPANVCPHCGAKFERALKFCGECGKTMAVAK